MMKQQTTNELHMQGGHRAKLVHSKKTWMDILLFSDRLQLQYMEEAHQQVPWRYGIAFGMPSWRKLVQVLCKCLQQTFVCGPYTLVRHSWYPCVAIAVVAVQQQHRQLQCMFATMLQSTEGFWKILFMGHLLPALVWDRSHDTHLCCLLVVAIASISLHLIKVLAGINQVRTSGQNGSFVLIEVNLGVPNFGTLDFTFLYKHNFTRTKSNLDLLGNEPLENLDTWIEFFV